MLEEFMARGARLRGVRVRPSRFKAPHTDALWLGTREIAHTHRGQVDVRLTRAVVRELRDELRSDARIDLRGPGFDWILLRVRNRADVERAMDLLRQAMRAAATTAARAGSPRSGASSASRRRRSPDRAAAPSTRAARARRPAPPSA